MGPVRSVLVVALVAALGAACSNHHLHGGGATYVRLELDPPQAALTIPLGGSATQDYTVIGIDVDGRKTDITASCMLAVDAQFGSFAAATPATLNALPHGGKTLVTANCDTLAATSELVINLTGTIVIGPSTPAGAPGLFGTATPGTDATRAPPLQYPLDGAVSPRNIPPIEIQWAAAGNDLFHVVLQSSYVTVDVYTTAVQATLDAPSWDAIAGSAAGDQLAISIEGLLQSAPSTKYAGATVTLAMSQDVIDKTAIYWWASSQGNIMSQTFGQTNAPSKVQGNCTACHSVSRSASRIGYSRCVANNCGNVYVGFLKYDPVMMTWNEAVNADAMTIHGSYTTFAPVGNPFPDDSKSLAIVSMADGTLWLYDPDTGASVPSNIAVANVAGHSSLMADWSPDGSKIVFTQTPTASQWIDLANGAIMMMDYHYNGGMHVFGTPQQIVPSSMTLANGTYTNFFFPSFSSDGALIVFNATRGAWRNSTSEESVGPRLMLSDGAGAWHVDLANANGGAVDYDNTWAHWAPTQSSDYYWLVFSSERDYGHEVTAANTNPTCKNVGVAQCKQIWIAAIARNKLTGAVDPSAPPMWLPGQDVTADNISPYWSVPAGIQ